MNKEDIIRLAREAGGDDWGIFREFMPEIERFAALIATVEREECAKVCDDWQNSFEIDTRGWWASSLCAITIRARGENGL